MAPSQEVEFTVGFRPIFEAEFDYVWTSLRRLGIPERDLDDLTHDVFVEVHRKLAAYDPSRPIRPWLFAFAFRIASEYRRRARHRFELLGTDRDPAARATPADVALVREEDAELLAAAFKEVELERRAVLVLYELDECPMKEIAATMGIPLYTAYSRLRLAREELTAAVRRLQRGRGEL